MTRLFIADVDEGIDRYDYNAPIVERTPHKVGIIKLATGDEPINAHQELIFRAVVNTHRETGVPILTHTNAGLHALEQANLFSKLGADLSHLVISYMDRSPSLRLIGSQSVKTMSVTTLKGYDGNNKLTGHKQFIIVDVLGLVLALRLTSANVGERAGAFLLFTALGQRFPRLKTILADQGFDGVNFLATVKATYQLTVNVVCGVLGVKGFQPGRRRGVAQTVDR